MNFSLGYHTFAIFDKLTYAEAESILKAFLKQNPEIRTFQIRKVDLPPNADAFTKWLYSSFPKYYVMDYPGQNKGITWLLRMSYNSPGYIKRPPGYLDRSRVPDEDKPCSIRAIINPKVFTAVSGRKDYLTAASAGDLGAVKSLFNMEVEKISPLLGYFDSYSMNRGDYCANFLLQGFEKYCPSDKIEQLPMMIMELIKLSDCPTHYSEWTKDDKVDDDKIGKHSHRLESRSGVISIYYKKEERLTKQPGCPNIEDYDFLRFEYQAKYPKMYQMTRNIKSEGGASDLIEKILSEDVCADIITKYFYRVIKPGDYYTFDVAKRMIESQVYRWEKVVRLVDALKLIAIHGGIANAKATFQDKDKVLEDFRRSLRELAKLGINPVTIPDKWGISHLPNLLDTYYDQLKGPLTREEKSIVARYDMEKLIETETLHDLYPTSMKKKKH